jgi:hypothetical protein
MNKKFLRTAIDSFGQKQKKLTEVDVINPFLVYFEGLYS